MKNYIQNGDSITITAAADVTSGAGVVIGKMFGIATGDALSGAQVTIVRKGVFNLPKLAAQAWTVGAKVYWNDSLGQCTTVVGTNTLIGCAVQVAADPSDSGIVLVDGAIH